MSAFRSEWIALGNRLAIPASRWADAVTDLETRYAEEHRHYHTVQHLDECWEHTEQVRGAFEKADWVLLALLYHDVIYRPEMQNNEEASAEHLAEQLGPFLSSECTEMCARMIKATKSHQATGHPDTDLLLDIDMSSLGAEPTRYCEYADHVARECVPVYGETAYRSGRAAMCLTPTLKRTRIFFTESFEHLETSARRNLTEELARTRSASGV